MRLFVALDFNEHKDFLVGLQQRFKSLGKFTFPKSFHLTLKFLGEVPDSQVERIKDALREVNFKSFDVNLYSLGVFPGQSYVRVIWIGLEPAKPVVELQQQVDAALGNPDKRFHPHITLARVTFVKDKQALDSFLQLKTEPRMKHIDSFSLVKSTLSAAGPMYDDLAHFSEWKDI